MARITIQLPAVFDDAMRDGAPEGAVIDDRARTAYTVGMVAGALMEMGEFDLAGALLRENPDCRIQIVPILAMPGTNTKH